MVSELKTIYKSIFQVFCASENQICKFILQKRNMSFYELRLEYASEGGSNHIDWKDKMEFMMEDNGLKEFINNDIPKPLTSNAKDLAECGKCV